MRPTIGNMGVIGGEKPKAQQESPQQSLKLRELMQRAQRALQTSLHEQAGNIDVAPAMWDQAEAELREALDDFIRSCRPAPTTAVLVGSEEPSDSHSEDPTDEAGNPEEK